MQDDALGIAIRIDVIERQIQEEGPNHKWDEEFPDDMSVDGILAAETATLDKVQTHGRQLVVFFMGLGRLMHLARQLSPDAWDPTPYRNFDDFMQRGDVDGQSRKYRTRYTAKKIYTQYRDVPLDRIQDSPIGQLSHAAGLMKTRQLSDQQKDILIDSTKLPSKEYHAALADNNLVPRGEESLASVEVLGFVDDVEHVKEFLKREDLKDQPNNAARLTCAIAEFENVHGDGSPASLAGGDGI